MELPSWLGTTGSWLQKKKGQLSGSCKKASAAADEFETLTPNVDPNKTSYQPYFRALDYALSREDVKNIAVTGAYGAGKSSIILSYLQLISARKTLSHKIRYLIRLKKPKHVDDHVIISLANFETDETLRSSESLSKEQSIEYSILQQILYKVDKGSLPDSRVERIHTRNWWRILGTTSVLFFTLMLIFINTTLLFPDKIISVLSLPSDLKQFISDYPVWRIGSIIMFSFIICWCFLSRFYRIGFFDKKIALDKINLLKGEIDAEKQNTTSLLNLYIDEIVYFFHKTKFRIVVFEDLDRLNNGHIFIKLREINQVVNNSKLLEKHPIRFVFAVREDLLKDAESQTKFFDFIIPIIPAVDAENVFDILSTKLDQFNTNNKEQFFKNISLYITDMRVMNNVINEFKLFKELISGELSDKKLFSLIVYKNLCTKDFTRLDKREGLLYEVMKSYAKKTLHSTYYKEHEDLLLRLQERIHDIESERARSDDALRKEFLNRYITDLFSKDSKFYCSVAGQGIDYFYINDLITDKDKFEYFLHAQSDAGARFELNGFQRKLPIPIGERKSLYDEYIRRCSLINQKSKDSIDKLNKDIASVKVFLNKRTHISLSELCQLMTFDKFQKWLLVLDKESDTANLSEDGEKIKQDQIILDKNIEMLFFLLSNGYLEQDYVRYRSIFHPGSLSHNDNLFIQKLASKLSFDEIKDLKLDNIENVYEKIYSLSFNYYEGVLHPEVINYLINYKLAFAKEVLHHLVDNGADALVYNVVLIYYKESGKDSYADLINIMLGKTKLMEKILAVAPDENNEDHCYIFNSYFLHGQLDNLKRQTHISHYISKLKQDTVILKYIEENDIDEFMNRLKTFPIAFDNLSESSDEKYITALKFIAQNNMYTFNLHNLFVLYNVYAVNEITEEEFGKTPYSYLIALNNEALTKNLYELIDGFVKNHFIHSEEGLSAIIALLNASINSQSKKLIIEEMAFEIDSLADIDNEQMNINGAEQSLTLYEWLFTCDKSIPDWKNVFHFIDSDGDSAILWDFIGRHRNILLGNKIIVPEKLIDEVDMQLINIPDVSIIADDLYEAIVKTLPIKIDGIDSDLSFSRFKILCENNRVELSDGLFKDAVRIYNKIDGVDLKKCLALIAKNNIDVFVEGMDEYLDIDGEFDIELIELILNDSEVMLEVKLSIINLIWPNFRDVFFDYISLRKDINMKLIPMLTNDRIRLEFFNYLLEFDELSSEFIVNTLNSFVTKEYSLVADITKRAKLSITTGNISLLELLVKCHFISSFKNRGEYLEVYHHRLTMRIMSENIATDV